MSGRTWVQPWHRPVMVAESARARCIQSPAGPSAAHRRISRSLCRHSPVGLAATWMPPVVYRAWSFRVRPDLATKVIPLFPYLTADGFRARREWLSARDEVIF
jgi:hypothetical protein